MKYVIGRQAVSGHYSVSVFGEDTVHRFAAMAMVKSAPGLEIVSAGFVHRDEGKWVVGGDRSESLDLGPGVDDQLILNLFLHHGLTGLDLMNMLAYLAFNPSLGVLMGATG